MLRRLLNRLLDWLMLAPGVVLVGAALVSAALRPGRRQGRPRAVFGPTPIISLSGISRAMRSRGYVADTLVHQPYRINQLSDFDLLIDDLPLVRSLHRLKAAPLARRIAPYAAFAYALPRYDLFHSFFDGGMLMGSPLAWLEPLLLHATGRKLVVMPYGSDCAIPSRIQSLPWRHGLMDQYSHLGRHEARTTRRVQHLCRHADHVVACMVHAETLPRWDSLTNTYYPIDTAAWPMTPHRPTADGVGEEVVVGHSPNHRLVKGTAFLVAAVERLRQQGLRIRLELMEGIPNGEVRQRLAQCDILVEQLHLGYALSAMEGLALGRPVISNLEDERYYRVHRQHTGLDQCPIVSSGPERIEEHLRRLATDPELRQRLGEAGRAYAETYHSMAATGRFWDLLWRHLWGNGTITRKDLLTWHPLRDYPDDHSW